LRGKSVIDTDSKEIFYKWTNSNQHDIFGHDEEEISVTGTAKFTIGLFSGLLGGFFGGLLGLGGGVIMIPLMTWLAKITQHQAHGTSLVAIVFTAIVGAATYYVLGGVDWKIALILAISATITARFGARYAHSLPEKKLRMVFGFFLIFASTMLVAKGYLPKSSWVIGTWTGIIVFLMIGFITGFVSGMMGVGGGGVMVPLMVVLGNVGQHMAQGTSLLAMIPASMSGASTHYKLGNVKLDIAWGLIPGSLIGAYFGATAANHLPDFYLKVVFAAVGVWMGTRYIQSGKKVNTGDRQ
jgi:hypothetical protein